MSDARASLDTTDLKRPLTALIPTLDEPHTAALLVHLPRLRARLDHLRGAFNPDVIHCIAIKTHPHPEMLRELVTRGFGLEAASIEEVRRALTAGCPSERLIFDSPVKTRSEIAEVSALTGALVNVNSLGELTRFESSARCRIGIRVNPLRDTGSPDLFSVGRDESKFGVPLSERAALVDAVLTAPVSALHMHSGSQMRDLEAQRDALSALGALALELNEALERAGLTRRIEVIDIGGGLPSEPLASPESAPPESASPESAMRAYATLVHSVESLRNFKLMTEFGQWVHAECGVALSRIEYVIEGSPQRLFIHLGADHFMRDAYLTPRAFPLSLWSPEGQRVTEREVDVDIAGPLCFAGDYLARAARLPQAEEGSWLCIDHTGANTYALWSRHCSRAVPALWAWTGEAITQWSERHEINY